MIFWQHANKKRVGPFWFICVLVPGNVKLSQNLMTRELARQKGQMWTLWLKGNLAIWKHLNRGKCAPLVLCCVYNRWVKTATSRWSDLREANYLCHLNWITCKISKTRQKIQHHGRGANLWKRPAENSFILTSGLWNKGYVSCNFLSVSCFSLPCMCLLCWHSLSAVCFIQFLTNPTSGILTVFFQPWFRFLSSRWASCGTSFSWMN